MVDIDQNDKEQLPALSDAPERAPETAAAPEVTSPLSNLVKSMTGSKKDAAPVKPKPVVKGAPVAENATASIPLPAGPLVTVVTRNEFYRDGFRNMIRIAILQAIVIIGLIATLVTYISNVQPSNRYFATTADGRIMQLVPLDKPSIAPAALMSWVSQAVSETMTFGFHDYQRRLQQSSRHFTRRGWETFTTALQKARIVDAISANQQVVTTEPRSAPILVKEGVFNGKYRWIIKLPIRVNYKSGKEARADLMTVQLVVERVPSLENPSGVGIEQWIATQQ